MKFVFLYCIGYLELLVVHCVMFLLAVNDIKGLKAFILTHLAFDL